MDNVIDSVHRLIAGQNLKQANRFRKHFNNSQALNVFKLGEIGALNAYWRLQLGLIRKNSTAERECLVDGCRPDIWLNNFRDYVLPTIISEQLPNV